jgi:hypothetical protein
MKLICLADWRRRRGRDLSQASSGAENALEGIYEFHGGGWRECNSAGDVNDRRFGRRGFADVSRNHTRCPQCGNDGTAILLT